MDFYRFETCMDQLGSYNSVTEFDRSSDVFLVINGRLKNSDLNIERVN